MTCQGFCCVWAAQLMLRIAAVVTGNRAGTGRVSSWGRAGTTDIPAPAGNKQCEMHCAFLANFWAKALWIWWVFCVFVCFVVLSRCLLAPSVLSYTCHVESAVPASPNLSDRNTVISHPSSFPPSLCKYSLTEWCGGVAICCKPLTSRRRWAVYRPQFWTQFITFRKIIVSV